MVDPTQPTQRTLPDVCRVVTRVAVLVCLVLVAWPAAINAGDDMILGAEAAAADVCSPEWVRDVQTGIDGGAAWTLAPAETGLAASTTPGGAIVTDDTPPEEPFQEPYSRYPNDTYFQLYQRDNLMEMGALDAWETSRGGADVTVAVISTGVDTENPDLAGKIWRNPGEVPGNGLDDDGNGYVDDVRGWNFPLENGDPSDIPLGRGTMMAGIVGAATNNREGIAGISWGARIMPLKTLVLHHEEGGDRFVGTVGDVVEAVCYGANNGAHVILFGGYLGNPDSVAFEVERLRLAIEYAHTTAGAVVVAAAGDCALPHNFCPNEADYGPNPPIVPAIFQHVIGVQSFGQAYRERDEASHGPWVDISAPGERFMTTYAGSEQYVYVRHQRATSDFAAAHIAGVVSVLRSINPDASPFRIETLLCDTADRSHGGAYAQGPLGQRNDRWGCGAVDFERALEAMPPKIRVTPERVRVFTDGSEPWPAVAFENAFMRANTWVVHPERATWLLPDQVEEAGDLLSLGVVRADLDQLKRDTGPLQSGRTYTETLNACPLGWERYERYEDLCQAITFELSFVDEIQRVYLPLAAN